MTIKYDSDQTRKRAEPLRTATWAYALFGAIVLFLGQGIKIFVVNQYTYFIYPQRLFNSHFLLNDWYTWQTEHHHIASGYFIWFLQWLGPLPVTANIAQFVLMFFFAAGTYLICKKACRYPGPSYLMVIIWIILSRPERMGLGLQDFFTTYLGPSTISCAFFVLGFALVLYNCYYSGFLFLGLAGLFHLTYLVAFSPVVFVLLWCFRKEILKEQKWLSLISLFGLWGVAVGIALYFSLGSETNAYAFNPYNIFADYAYGFHYNLQNWRIWPNILWSVWVLSGYCFLINPPRNTTFRPIAISFHVTIAVVVLSVLLSWFNVSITLRMLSPWRSGTWTLLLSIILISDRFLEFTFNFCRKRKTSWSLNFVLLGIVWLLWVINTKRYSDIFTSDDLLLVLMPLLIFFAYLLHRLMRTHKYMPLIISALLMSVYALLLRIYLRNNSVHYTLWFLWGLAPVMSYGISKALAAFRHKSNKYFTATNICIFLLLITGSAASYYGIRNYSRNGLDRSEPGANDMIQWVRTNTQNGDVFIISPYDPWFRQAAQRAVVVDMYGLPMQKSELWEWWERISCILGYENINMLPERANYGVVQKKYNNLDYSRSLAIAEKYGADYILIRHRSHTGDFSPAKPIYKNTTFALYKLSNNIYEQE